MNPERWQQIERLYYAALAREPDERAAFLDSACASDENLRLEVASLVAAGDRVGTFMEAPLDFAAEGLERLGGTLQPSMIGETLGHYRIVSLLGRGAMGEVYLGEDPRLGRKVALKLLPAVFTSNPERLRRFKQEARAVSALNHPNIITIYEIGQVENGKHATHYLVTEYIEGETLGKRMQREPLSVPSALDITIAVASALAAAHVAGITHRDIKPENVMLRPDGLVKVLDFGLAKFEQRPALGPESIVNTQAPTTGKLGTTPGIVMGTVSYMSPEQARGLKVDHRTDIFSLGVMLYELVAGRRPFEGATASDVIVEILRSEPLPLSQLKPGLQLNLQPVISRMLEKEREARYESAAELVSDLNHLRESQSSLVGLARRNRDVPRRGRTSWLAGVAVVFAIVLAIAVLLWLYLRPTLKQQPFAQSLVPLTSSPGRELQPAFSPDGHQFAFAGNGEKGDNYDIYVKQIDGGTPLQLTTSPADDLDPVWSPDSQRIAFVRYTAKERSIFAVPALGGPERKLASASIAQPPLSSASMFWDQPTVTGRRSLSWSPDGKLLAFPGQASPEEPYSIFLLSVEALEKRKLTTPPPTSFGDWDPAFSPDGNTLAFSRRIGSGFDIYLVPVAGGEARRLTFENPSMFGLAWIPDGRGIVFFSNLGATSTLWKISTSGGAQEQLATFAQGASTPTFDRQGHLGYVQHDREVSIWRVEVPGGTIRASPPTRVVRSTRIKNSPNFSADGKKVVFISPESGKTEIWTCDSDGLNPVLLSTNLPNPATPRWSPDGQHIAFASSEGGHPDIYVIRAEGGRPSRLTTETSNDVWPSWSRDGQWIYFGSDRGGNWQVWKMPADGGQAVQVTRNGAMEAFASPDGKFVYYAKSNGVLGIWRIPVEGGEEVRVIDQGSPGSWGVAENGIYFADPEAKPGPTIHFFSFATRELTQIATVEKRLLPGPGVFAVSSDGHWILYTQFDRNESDIWLVKDVR